LTEIDRVNSLLTSAINKYDNNSWRIYRTNRNILDKIIKQKKHDHLLNKFKGTNDRWKMIKEHNGNNKTHPPQCIINNGQSVTSPKQLCTIAHNYFIEKVNNIKNAFNNHTVEPIQILSKLIPKNNNKFILPETNVNEIIKIINKLK